ncbi:sigma-70 family RNA polymerase sigma factor [bacterium M00.F.Ca.ET.194.01.1.1]|nr:sigma-70 family RNA polymerase sigma factor [bacterium M00.F.Ca.ET.194.01.1.1]TGS52524.1 sigma-70 family RNA polymerase sigma factor [bacterium M00.F.Ca.ET.179.01.1.1]TGV44380.1 sigma-70 family RNA polymerase sigma factor [bacterium M00.F.Ca.ET.168.01.1.1]
MDTREDSWAKAMRAERTGDSAAYEAFLRAFAASVRRIAETHLRYLGFGRYEAEDVVQEVLIAVHSRRHQWDTERSLLPWLNAITRYKIIDASRRLGRDARMRVDLTEEQWAGLFSSEGVVDPERNPADVEKLISALPPGEQAAVRAIGLEGASTKEAAARIGSTEGAVRVAFHRSLKKLMAATQRRGPGHE